MIICPKCGKDNRDTAKFCRGCGQPINHITLKTPAYQSHQAAQANTVNMPPVPAPKLIHDPSPAATQVTEQPSEQIPLPGIFAPSTTSDHSTIPLPTSAGSFTQSSPVPFPASQSPVPVPPFNSHPHAHTDSVIRADIPSEPQEQSQAPSASFGEWLTSALTKPSKVITGKPAYGIAVIFATNAITALMFIVVLWHLYDDLSSFLPRILSYYLDDYASNAGLFLFLCLWLGSTASLYATLGCLRLTRAVMADPIDFTGLHNEYAHKLTPWLCCYTLALLIAFMRLDVLALLIWAIAVWAQNVWLYALIWEGESHRSIDSQWTKFLMTLLMAILQCAVAFFCTVTVLVILAIGIGLSATDAIQSLLNSF